MLNLAFLGPPEVRHAGQVLTFPTRKTRALLAYLAVQGGRQPREKLTALLWPESDDERGRSALRQTLALLTDALRSGTCQEGTTHLVVRREALAFDFGSRHQLDVQVVLAASALANSHSGPPTVSRIRQLQDAVERYRGDFLEGFSLSDAPEFDVWASTYRELLHRRVDGLLDSLSRWQCDTGDLHGAIDTAARWVAHNRLNETAHRRVMELRFLTGDRAAALQAYETCSAILDEELGTHPDVETQALAARIRSEGAPRRPLQERPPFIPAPSVEMPMVGRADAHGRLVADFYALPQSGARAVVVRGEAGIGKTRLVAEFLRWATGHGSDVLEGRAFEAGGGLPYQPLLEAFRSRLRMEPELRQLLSDTWLAELSQVLPEVRDRCPGLPIQPTTSDAAARARLFEAAAVLGEAIARRAPTVLFIDDVQWADSASLDLLQYAARHWSRARAPLLLVLGVRTDATGDIARLAEWLHHIGRDVPVTSLSLTPLSALDTLELVRACWDQAALAAPDAAVAAEQFGGWLFAETRGHPFFLVEMLKSLVERGVLTVGGQGTWTANPDSGDLTSLQGFVPPSVRDVVCGRLERLDPVARNVITAAAVLGHRVDFDVLHRVAELSERDTLAALDTLLARSFLQEAEESGACTFVHDKVREVVYAEAGDARRRVLHRCAADVLEQSGAPAAELARHAFAAGMRSRAIQHSMSAGDDALHLFAAQDARVHYERALAWLELLDSAAERAQYAQHLYAELGRASELAGDETNARHAYENLLRLARDTGQPELEIRALNRLAGVAVRSTLNLETAAALLGSAQERLAASGDKASRADTELSLAELSMFRWNLNSALDHAKRALALARELDEREQVARSLNMLATVESHAGRVDDGVVHAEEAQEIANALGNQLLEADSLCLVAEMRVRLGHIQASIDAASRARILSAHMRHPQEQARSAHKLAIGLVDAGRYEEALHVAQEGVELARWSGHPMTLLLNLLLVGNAQRALWAVEDAWSTHMEAWRLNASLPCSPFTELLASNLAADAAIADDWGEAAVFARLALELRDYAVLNTGFYRWYETEALLRAGDIDQAEEDLRLMEAQVRGNCRFELPSRRAAAVLALWHGDLAAAWEHLEGAHALARRMGMAGQVWQVQAAQAEVAHKRGELERARVLLDAATSGLNVLASLVEDRTRREQYVRRASQRLLARPTVLGSGDRHPRTETATECTSHTPPSVVRAPG